MQEKVQLAGYMCFIPTLDFQLPVVSVYKLVRHDASKCIYVGPFSGVGS